jgi:hypothetical protein
MPQRTTRDMPPTADPDAQRARKALAGA